MEDKKFRSVVESILTRDARYKADAYYFVRQALERAQKSDRKASKRGPQHLTGQQLLEGIREYAVCQFSAMAIAVFEEWGVQCSSDFGEIVFNMIEAQLFSKTEQDCRADFC